MIVLAQANESMLIVVWTVAVLTLFFQAYLFVTWPRQATTDTIPIPEAKPDPQSTLRQRIDAIPNLPPNNSTAKRRTTPAGSVPEMAPRETQRNKGPATFRDRVVRAGLYSKSSAATVYLVRIMMTIAAFAIVYFITLWLVPIVELQFLAAAFAGIAAYITPSFWLDYRLKTRQMNIRRALPDALDLVTVCMRGGLSLPGALARVSRELSTAHPMLAAELGIVEREIQMGRTAGAAMRHFAQRLDLEELRSLSSVVWQTERFGGSIVGALATYASSMRVKRKQHAEEMAQKAAVKLLFPTLLCIFPGIFVVVLGPTAIRFYQILLVGNPF